jgi:hypothetical protein
MTTKQKGIPSYDNAQQDEPLFVLRAQDMLAPEIVREWAYRALAAGTPHEKVDAARKCADEMENYQIQKQAKKVPD